MRYRVRLIDGTYRDFAKIGDARNFYMINGMATGEIEKLSK